MFKILWSQKDAQITFFIFLYTQLFDIWPQCWVSLFIKTAFRSVVLKVDPIEPQGACWISLGFGRGQDISPPCPSLLLPPFSEWRYNLADWSYLHLTTDLRILCEGKFPSFWSFDCLVNTTLSAAEIYIPNSGLWTFCDTGDPLNVPRQLVKRSFIIL